MAASSRSPAQRRASKANIKKAQCAKIAKARGYCKPKRASSKSRSSSRSAEERSESARKAARTRKRNMTKMSRPAAKRHSSGSGNKKRSSRSIGSGSTRRQSELASLARRSGISVRQARELLQLEGLRTGRARTGGRNQLRSAMNAGSHRVSPATRAVESANARSENRNPNGTFRAGSSRINNPREENPRMENPRRRRASTKRGKKRSSRRKSPARRMTRRMHNPTMAHGHSAMGEHRALGATDMAVAVAMAAGSYVVADLVDRFLATRGKNGAPYAVGGQANALIQSKPNAMRLGVQAGVAILGGLGSWYLAGKNPTAASLAGGLAGGFGTHLLVQLVNTQLMPVVLKSSSLNDQTLGNRLYPEDQPAFQAVYAAQASQMAGQPAPAPLPASSTTTAVTTTTSPAMAQRRRSYGMAGVGEAQAGYPQTYAQAGVGCPGKADCGCSGEAKPAGLGCACNRPSQDWRAMLAQGSDYGTNQSWDGNLSYDGTRGMWLNGVGSPATGPQIEAYLARQRGQAGVGCAGQPSAVPLMLDRSGKYRHHGRGMSMPKVSQDAAGNLFVQPDPSSPTVYAAAISPLDCSSMNVSKLIPIADGNGMTIGFLDPEQASWSMQMQDQSGGGMNQMPSMPGMPSMPSMPSLPMPLNPSTGTPLIPLQNVVTGQDILPQTDHTTRETVSAHQDPISREIFTVRSNPTTGQIAEVKSQVANGPTAIAMAQSPSSAAEARLLANAVMAPAVRPGSLTFPERRSGQKRMTPRQRKNMMAGLPLDDGDASN